MSFLEELVQKGIITKGQIGDVKNRAREAYQGDLDAALTELGVPEEKLLEAKGQYLGLPVKKVDLEDMSFTTLKYVSEDSAEHYRFVPLELKDGVLEVGVRDPETYLRVVKDISSRSTFFTGRPKYCPFASKSFSSGTPNSVSAASRSP